MFKKESIKGFVAGALAALTATAMATVFAEPVEQMISVIFDDYRIIIDGADKSDTPEDSKPFVYNGRTYVPLRYIGEALGKQVTWEGTTKTIYINDDGSEREDVYFATMPYDKAKGSIELDAETNTVRSYEANGHGTVKRSITYNLNGLAKNIIGTIDMVGSGSEVEGKLTIYDQDDKILYETPILRSVTKPISFDVPTKGALQIRVEFVTIYDGSGSRKHNLQIKDFRYSK